MTRSQRDAAIVAAWYEPGSEADVARRFDLSSHSVQLIWVNARRVGLIPQGVKRLSSSWHLVARLDLNGQEVPMGLSVKKKVEHSLDGICGAPSVGGDALLIRLQKVYPSRRYEDATHRA